MKDNPVTIDPKALASLGGRVRSVMPIDRQPDPMGLGQFSIEKKLSPRSEEKVFEVDIRLKTPGK